jgi:hypothetical protein
MFLMLQKEKKDVEGNQEKNPKKTNNN